MPASVTAADLLWLRRTAADLGDLRDRRAVAETAMTLVGQRVHSAVSTYNELNLGGPAAIRAGLVIDDAVADLRRRLEQHPLFAPVVRGSTDAPGAPIRMSDVLGLRAWRDHPIYREILAPRDLPLHTVCLVTTHGRALEWYQFNRDRDFDGREVDLLTRLQPALIALLRRAARPPAPALLTARELEVLQLVAAGLTVAATARRLGIAPGTVRKHLEHVHGKLGTSGPVATVARAVRLGLLDLP